jgi:hypothetical protein
MPIDSIGPRQPGMIPEPESEGPAASTGQAVQRAQGPKATGEASATATPKQAADLGQAAAAPKFWEPAGERLGEAKFQGMLTREKLTFGGEKTAQLQQKLPEAADAGVWEAKFRGEAAHVAELKHKAVSDLQAQGKLQFADEKVSMAGQKLHGEVEKKWDKDLQVQEKLKHAGERMSQNSVKLAGEVQEKSDKDLLVRDKVKLANETAITMSRSKSQITGGAAGVWEAKLQGEGRSAAGIDDVKGHKSVSTHKNLGQIGPESSGAQFDKDHKAFSVAENLGMAQSQNIWGERNVRQGDLEIQENVNLSVDLRIVETKPPDIKG